MIEIFLMLAGIAVVCAGLVLAMSGIGVAAGLILAAIGLCVIGLAQVGSRLRVLAGGQRIEAAPAAEGWRDKLDRRRAL